MTEIEIFKKTVLDIIATYKNIEKCRPIVRSMVAEIDNAIIMADYFSRPIMIEYLYWVTADGVLSFNFRMVYDEY